MALGYLGWFIDSGYESGVTDIDSIFDLSNLLAFDFVVYLHETSKQNVNHIYCLGLLCRTNEIMHIRTKCLVFSEWFNVIILHYI